MKSFFIEVEVQKKERGQGKLARVSRAAAGVLSPQKLLFEREIGNTRSSRQEERNSKGEEATEKGLGEREKREVATAPTVAAPREATDAAAATFRVAHVPPNALIQLFPASNRVEQSYSSP